MLAAVSFNIILFIGCLYFAYHWIDTSITLAYIKPPCDMINNQNNTLRSMLQVALYGLTEKQVMAILEKEHNLRTGKSDTVDDIMSIRDDILHYDGFDFTFHNGRLVKIE
jgi:hypothetical protein